MEINDIITLEDNQNYLILDMVSIGADKYYYCVKVDEHDMPIYEYKYLKEIKDKEETFMEPVTDQDTLEAIVSMFSLNYLNEKNVEQED